MSIKLKKVLSLVMAAALMAPATAILANDVDDAVKASNQALDKEAIKLLIYASVLSSKSEQLIAVSPDVERTYNNIRNGVFASLPVGVTLGATGSLAAKSADEFQSVLKPITILVQQIGKAVAEVAKSSFEILDKLGVDVLLRSSGESIEKSVELMQPLIKLLVSKGFLTSVGTISGSALLGGSSFLLWNSTVEDAIDNGGETARRILGYNRELNRKVDQVADDLSVIFSMKSEEKAKFKEAFVNELIRLASEKEFSPTADYDINVIEVLAKTNLVPRDVVAAAGGLQALVKAATQGRVFQVSEQEKLSQNIDTVVAAAAILESILQTEKLSPADEKEVTFLLYNARRNLELVQLNFRGVK